MARHLIIVITAVVLIYTGGCTEEEKADPVVEPPQMPIIDIIKIRPLPEPNIAPEPNAVDFHNVCADILKNYVNENGLVDYTLLRRREKFKIKDVVKQFATLDAGEYKSWSQADKVVFWVNAYNINKFAAVIENYPIESTAIARMRWGDKSIRHILPKLNIHKFLVMDEEFSFTAVESDILGKEFDDPRILLALTQLTLSSPVIYNRPYYGKNLDAVLDEHIKSFLVGQYGLKIDRNAGVVYLPSVLHPNFYGKKFIAKYGTDKKFKDKAEDVRAVLSFISGYIPENQKDFLERKNYTVKYNKYDWTLNDSSR